MSFAKACGVRHENIVRLARLPRAASDRARGYLPVRPKPAILMYHRIAIEPFDPWGLAVSPARFEAQMAWLARNRTILPLDDLAGRHRERRLPGDALAITFDDGYACVGETAAPVLKRLGIPATIFLATKLIGQQEPFWWDALRETVLETSITTVRLDDEEVTLGPRTDADRKWQADSPPRTARQKAFWHLWIRLRHMTPLARDAAMKKLSDQCSVAQSAPAGARAMSSEEIRAIRSAQITFGSHTLGHASLTALSPDEKVREIRVSAEVCETLTGAKPRAIAYPFGDFDAESERIAEEAGYECACTTETAAIGQETRLFALPRLNVGNWSPRRLRRALANA